MQLSNTLLFLCLSAKPEGKKGGKIVYIEENLKLVYITMEEGIRVNFVGSSYSLPRFNPIILSDCPDTKTKTK